MSIVKSKQLKEDSITKAFTLLELLLVIAVIASLAGVILSALNPAARLQSASDTKSVAKSNELKKAIQAYTLDNSGYLPANILALTSYGIYDVCKQGQSTNCVNLDVLVTNGYLSEIPTDSDGTTSVISGYKIEYDPSKTTVNTYSTDALTSYVQNGATLTKGLVGYWKMDENTGTTTADSSGNGNTGTLTNGPTWTSGRYASSLNFDGTNDYISIPHSETLDANEFTVSLWIKRVGAGTGASQFIILKNGMYGLNWNGSILQYYDNAYHNSTNTLPLNTWTNITMVHKNNIVLLYVDGNLDSSTASVGTPNLTYNAGLEIGRMNPNYFNGLIDEVRIYGRPLSSEEVNAIFNYAPPPVAQWKFDEGTGTTAADSSGNGNNGTLTNGPTWVQGKFGNALNFDGSNGYLPLPANLSKYDRTGTITAWVKFNGNGSANSVNPIISLGGSTITTTGFALRRWESSGNCNLNRLELRILTTNKGICSSTAFQNGAWKHLAITANGVNYKIYIDGIEDTVYMNIGTNNGSWIYDENYSAINTVVDIGRQFYNNAAFSYANSSLDDVRIYNYPLSPTQIQKVMNNEI